MQNPRTGVRWMVAAITSISITAFAPGHAASVAPVTAENGMVVSAQHLATMVGVDVLKRGGNAVDAAVAVGYALAVVYPAAGNLGGGGFMTIQLADGRKTFLDFRETAPNGATANMYLDKDGNVVKGLSTKGHLAVGVPGSVSGMEYAREKYGTLKRGDLIAPALQLAEDGFALDQGDVDMLLAATKDFQEDPASAAIFLNNGKPFQVGEKLVQHELAETLREISKRGTDGFYKGWVGSAIVASSQAGKGLITQEDLDGYKTRELAPVECDYRGYHSAEAVHYQIEAMRHAYVDRNSYLGDPDFVKNPLDRLLDKNYAARIRAVIDPNKAAVSKDIKPGVEPHEGSNTTHYSIADKDGNAVSVTYTLNDWFGARVTAARTGVILNDEMDDFTAKIGVPNLYGLVQGEANAIAPGKRPLSSMSPTIVTKGGKPVIVVGTPGGSRIITAVLQTMINAIDYDMDAQEAADMPRFHQQWLPDLTNLENFALSPDTRKILEGKGHKFGPPQPANHLAVIVIGAPSLTGKPVGNNRFYGANDPRRNTGLAAGY